MEQKLTELKRRLAEVNDLNSAAALLVWDQSTYMPPAGAPARGRQLATLRKLAHERLTAPEIGHLLDDLEPYAARLPYDADEAGLIRVTRRLFERARNVPSQFVAKAQAHFAATFDTWKKARPANDFGAVQPLLEKSLALSRRYAEYFPGYAEIIDPLIDVSDYGMRASTIAELFGKLRAELLPLVQAVLAQPATDDGVLHRNYPEPGQKAFGEKIAAAFGYDFERGRQDRTPHPFMIKFSLGDVRITTRYRVDDLGEGLFSTLHETGHALYEQGIDREYEATPLARGTSAGIHESQSRLWENLVGRSREFWERFYPDLQAVFPAQLEDTSLEAFYRAINKVQASLIRTGADEVTYNLHVMMRFDFERALLKGEMRISDLPEAWRERLQKDLGIAPDDDRDGVLQDVHWFSGFVGGAFQGYTLGNIMSAQFYEAALDAHPEIPDEIRAGRFDTLLHWLQANIYRHGRKFTADEIVERATGHPLSIDAYIAYLRRKYNELYAL